MTSHAAPALELIRLLVEGVGIGFDGSQQRRGTSFLFDMNRFFQELVSRFLHDNLDGYKVVDEAVLRGMYSPDITGRPRRPPAPRPDFAVIHREGRVANYLDAKYRDLWVKPLPADWLYQLTAYALASPSGSATIVYPTMSDDARPESIGVNDPVSRRPLGRVLLKPVLLPELSALVLDRSAAAAHQKRRIAAELAGMPAEESRNVSSSISAEPASRSLFPKRSGLPSSRTQPAN
jgi:5-methylcytosine-specific restriction enzyme subunit McrC